MAVKTVNELKTQIDGVIKINGNREITPPLDNSIRTNVIDSFLNLKDGGLILQAETGYSTPITPSSDYSFSTKKYVDDEIAGIVIGAAWGGITGTVTDQTDLILYLQTNYAELTDLAAYQPLATNLTSLSGLTYASTSFVKMTAAGTFALDTNTYVAGTGVASKLAYWTGSNTLSNGAYFDGTNLALGGISPAFNCILRMEKSFTTDALNIFNLNSAQGNHANGSTISNRMYGEYAELYHFKSYTLNNTINKYALTKADSASSIITNAYNFLSQISNIGTVSNMYHFGTDTNVNSGTLTNNYLFYNLNGKLLGTNKWFLYNDDNTVNSYLKGQLQLVGSTQNALVVSNGIKIANNTDSAATAGGGSIKYVASTLQYSDGSNWNTVGNATVLTATTTIIEASWSGNTDYEYSVTVTGAAAGDFCLIMPNNTVLNAVNVAAADWKGYAYCSSANTVTVVCRVSSFISVSGTFTVKVIK